MSELKPCPFCGGGATKIPTDDEYTTSDGDPFWVTCRNEECVIYSLEMCRSYWQTRNPGWINIALPEITPEMWDEFDDTDLMTWHDGPQWTQIAVDFVATINTCKALPPAPGGDDD